MENKPGITKIMAASCALQFVRHVRNLNDFTLFKDGFEVLGDRKKSNLAKNLIREVLSEDAVLPDVFRPAACLMLGELFAQALIAGMEAHSELGDIQLFPGLRQTEEMTKSLESLGAVKLARLVSPAPV